MNCCDPDRPSSQMFPLQMLPAFCYLVLKTTTRSTTILALALLLLRRFKSHVDVAHTGVQKAGYSCRRSSGSIFFSVFPRCVNVSKKRLCFCYVEAVYRRILYYDLLHFSLRLNNPRSLHKLEILWVEVELCFLRLQPKTVKKWLDGALNEFF